MVDMDSIKKDLKAEMRPRKLVRSALVPQFKGIANPIKDVFGIFVTLIGQLFVQAGLLTKAHPAMTGEITGFSAIWQMIVDASTKLEFKRENFYQIAVFYAIVGMLVFGVLGTITFMMHVGMGRAHAQTTSTSTSSTMFQDSGLAYGWINNMFAPTGGTGMAAALGPMLTLYNAGILALATFVALWSFISMVMDSAHHGEMGGKRHSELWAPIRLVFALGMLVPVSNGFNTIQLVTIALAHAGSGLGTTVWNSFQNTLTNPGNNTPTQTVDDLDEFVSKVFLIATCEEAANAFGGANTATSSGPVSQTVSGTAINYTMNYNLAPYQTGGCGTITVSASSASAGNSWMSVATGVYTTADTYAQKVVGMANSGGGAGYDSHADPGINWSTIISNLQTQITSTAQGLNANNASATTTTDSNGWANAGAVFIKMAQQASASAAAQARTFSATLPDPGLLPVSLGGSAGSIGSNAGCLAQGATTLMGGSQTFACSGTAAKETTAVLDSMSGYLVAAQNTAGVDAPLGGTSGSAGHDGVKWLLSKLAPQLQGVTSYLSGTTSTASTSSNGGSQAQTFGTAIFQIINFGNILFGLDGILWTLAIVAGAQGLGFSFGFGAVMILSILGSLVFSLALIFAIYIPLMPAIRFLFGIITWLVTIFEALVAMPIVMLVHLKSDGEGLWAHGQQGYLLLLQMLLRPVLMVFGLLGAVLVFTTLIEFIATSIIGTWFTVSGGNTMFLIGSLVSIFELFAFLVVYGFTVYSVANVSFNLINVIPDRILAWIGSSSPMHTADGMQDVMQSQSQSQLAGAHGNATGFLSQRQAVKSAIEPPARAPGDGGGDEKTPGALPKPGGGGGGGGGVKPANDSGNQQNLPGGPANDE